MKETLKTLGVIAAAVLVALGYAALIAFEIIPSPDQPGGIAYMIVLVWAIVGGFLAITTLNIMSKLRSNPTHCPPVVESVNGIGFRFIGSSDREETDPEQESLTTTLWVAVFFLPVYPIRRYRIRRKKGSQRSMVSRFEVLDSMPLSSRQFALPLIAWGIVTALALGFFLVIYNMR